jgi:integrase
MTGVLAAARVAARAHADWDEWRTLLKAAGIRQVRVHDARHAATTLLLAQGVDQRVLMEILGHPQISMTIATPMSCRR